MAQNIENSLYKFGSGSASVTNQRHSKVFLTAVGLELWLQKQHMLGTLKLKLRVDNINDCMSFIIIALPSQQNITFVMFTVISELITYTGIYQAFISSELYVQSSAILSVLYGQLLCKSVLNVDSYTFFEYANMHIIFDSAHGTGTAAVRLCTERYPQHRLLNPQMFCAIHHHIRETGTVHPCMSMVDWQTLEDGEVHEQLCGRTHSETCKGELLYQRSLN